MYEDGGYHCFACKLHREGKFIPPSSRKEEVNAKGVLPPDFQREVSAVGWKWLLQYGLPMSYWLPYVGWSEKDSRLVFTVGEPTVFSIGRDITGESKRKWFVWGDSHKTGVTIGEPSGKTVFVEDIVSAHKVGRVATAIPIFGTVVHPCHLKLARYLKQPIVLWLDKDQQGTTQKKANQISMFTGLPCDVVHTDKDPKELDLQIVKEALNVY